jgi:hypothetical protein
MKELIPGYSPTSHLLNELEFSHVPHALLGTNLEVGMPETDSNFGVKVHLASI